MKTPAARMLAVLASALAAGTARADDPPKPTVAITLGGRTACVIPTHRGQARAEGGLIDLTTPSPTVISASLTGAVAANAYLGCPGSATESFHLVQEFRLDSPDGSASSATLTLDSALVGFLRSKHNAGASVRLAAVKVCPIGWDGSPLVAVHPAQVVDGRDGRLCNQHLTPIVVPGMPVGRYVLTADFVLTAEAAGVADAHAAADFSPSTSLPADWVRTRDPFQGVDKKGFGLAVTLTAEATGAGSTVGLRKVTPELIRTSATGITPPNIAPPRLARPDVHGFERTRLR